MPEIRLVAGIILLTFGGVQIWGGDGRGGQLVAWGLAFMAGVMFRDP